MGKMTRSLSLLLMKQQTTFGTPESALVGTDLIETIGAPQLTLDPDMTDIRLVAGGFDQDTAVPGAQMFELEFSVYMRTGAAEDSLGQVGVLLPFCGMASVETSNSYAWTFSSVRSAWKDATAWMYSGDLSASGALLYKSGNILLSPKWTLATGKPTTMELKGAGTYVAHPAAGTQPSITKLRVSPPALLGASALTINGDSDYKLISAEIDAGVTAELTKDAVGTYGRALSQFTDRMITWKATVYKDTNVDPYTALAGRSEGAFTITHGTANNYFTYASSYAQIKDIQEGEEGGVETWELSGQFSRNDFTLTMDTNT